MTGYNQYNLYPPKEMALCCYAAKASRCQAGKHNDPRNRNYHIDKNLINNK